jgi:hypothetical protein
VQSVQVPGRHAARDRLGVEPDAPELFDRYDPMLPHGQFRHHHTGCAI